MERAQLSAAQGKERLQLIAARERLHLSLEEVAQHLGVSKTTVYRWEKKGDFPQPYHLRELCMLFGVTARELGFDEKHTVDVQTINHAESEEDECVLAFRQQNLISRLMRIVWNYPLNDARYQMLQSLVTLELEDNSMNNDEISRRDALRFLALVPADMLGLSQFAAVFKKGVSYEDILKHCSAGIVACWHLRKGKELAFADAAVSKYIPTLKALAQTAPIPLRKAAADLLAQCFLLKGVLSWAVTTPNDAIDYAQQAETYGEQAGSRLLQITALRVKSAALCYANRWEQALQAAEKAKFLLEERDKQDKQKQLSAFVTAEAPISQIIHSYVYAGLATYQAYHGDKARALLSLKKAHTTFFERPANEEVPIWCDHHVGNLLVNDGEAYMHLGMYKEGLDSLQQIDTQYAQDTTISFTNRVDALTSRVMAEVNRDDQPRDMEQCIDLFIRGIEGAKAVRSNLRFNAAVQAYTAMRAAWPTEKQVKDLREYIVHW